MLETLEPTCISFLVLGDVSWSVDPGMIPFHSQISFILWVPSFRKLSIKPSTNIIEKRGSR